MRFTLTLALLALLALSACASDPAPTCQLGRSQSCACSSGATGAQECGPLGVWSPCVCTGSDAGSDVSPAADVDASSDAAGRDVLLVDGAPAPRLYESCDLGGDCGAGLECLAVPWLDDAGTRGLCTLRCPGSNPGDCPGPTFGGVCVQGVGVGAPSLCARNCAGREGPDSTRCSSGQRCVRYQREGVVADVCAP
jgi:hypothetical protein